MLARGGLMDPCKHVPDIPRGIVGVYLDRSGQTIRSTSRECLDERIEGRGLSR